MTEDGYDYRGDNVANKGDANGRLAQKRTNNTFATADLPSDEEMYDDEERQEIEEERRVLLDEQAVRDEGEKPVTDDLDAILSEIDNDNERFPQGVYKRNMAALFTEYEYERVPRIPDEYRGATIIGLRTKPTGNSSIKIGAIAPKKKLRMIWDNMTDVEKYILMLISEHRHLTVDQLAVFVVLPSSVRQLHGGGHNSIKPYFEWVTKDKYGNQLNYKETHKTQTIKGLESKLGHLVDLNLIEEITPSYHVNKNDSALFNRTPSLYTSHYYLTPVGARVLVCNTLATTPDAAPKGKDKSEAIKHNVGYVSTYRNSAYLSIVHETESTDVLTSIAESAMFVSNIDALDGRADGDDKDYGFIDICRFYHEKDCEEKYVPYHDDEDMKDKTIDYKTDGLLTLYSSRLGEFMDYYLEYDSGSSSSSKIKHKIEAFIRYTLWQKGLNGYRFRKPVLLLVSQNPAHYMPGLRDDKPTRYTRGVEQLVKSCFKDHKGDINDIATVLVGDCRMIRMHGALGACWHKMDLITGVPERTAHDLLTASLTSMNDR